MRLYVQRFDSIYFSDVIGNKTKKPNPKYWKAGKYSIVIQGIWDNTEILINKAKFILQVRDHNAEFHHQVKYKPWYRQKNKQDKIYSLTK